MFNEQKRYELNIQRLLFDVHLARTSMEKMRTEAVNLRMKLQELRDEGKDRQHWKNVTPPSQTYDHCLIVAEES